MKVLIIGGGYASCCIARLLFNQGHQIIIFEKDNQLGGMAKSFYLEGMTYEFGPHILADHGCGEEVINFIKKHIDVVDTSMETASFIQNKYLKYPPHINDVNFLNEKKEILKQLKKLPKNIDETNFETYLISKLGKTLYEIYFKSFTEKFWMINPKKLDSDWAKLRHLGESLTEDKMFFNKNWCTYPKKDWNELFKNLTKNIQVKLNTKIDSINLQKTTIKDNYGNRYQGDLIINTQSIDKIFNFKYGELEYRGYDIKPIAIEMENFHPIHPKSDKHYSMVYYPEKHIPHTRITEYKSFNCKENDKVFKGKTIITVETPSKKAKFYPFMDKKNEITLRKYLTLLSEHPTIVSLGRLGLYKYTTTDTTTKQIFNFMRYLPRWKKMSKFERFNAYLDIRKN